MSIPPLSVDTSAYSNPLPAFAELAKMHIPPLFLCISDPSSCPIVFSHLGAQYLAFYARSTNGFTKPFSPNVELLEVKAKNHTASYAKGSIFSTINAAKQWEIKTFAPLSALAILTLASLPYLKSPSRWNPQKIVFPIISLALALGHSGYEKQAGLVSKEFEASGHMMMRTVLAIVSSIGLKELWERSPLFATVLGGTLALTDGIATYPTAYQYHSFSEIAIGAGWGVCIAIVAQCASRVFQQISQRLF